MGHVRFGLGVRQNPKNTLKYFAKNLLSDMTGKIDNLQNMINEIDEEKYTQVIDFAKALNGGREI